jgi:hypothetical protein
MSYIFSTLDVVRGGLIVAMFLELIILVVWYYDTNWWRMDLK